MWVVVEGYHERLDESYNSYKLSMGVMTQCRVVNIISLVGLRIYHVSRSWRVPWTTWRIVWFVWIINGSYGPLLSPELHLISSHAKRTTYMHIGLFGCFTAWVIEWAIYLSPTYGWNAIHDSTTGRNSHSRFVRIERFDKLSSRSVGSNGSTKGIFESYQIVSIGHLC